MSFAIVVDICVQTSYFESSSSIPVGAEVMLGGQNTKRGWSRGALRYYQQRENDNQQIHFDINRLCWHCSLFAWPLEPLQCIGLWTLLAPLILLVYKYIRLVRYIADDITYFKRPHNAISILLVIQTFISHTDTDTHTHTHTHDLQPLWVSDVMLTQATPYLRCRLVG